MGDESHIVRMPARGGPGADCMNDAISVQGLDKKFGGVRVLRSCSLGIPSGSVTGIIGPNGAGKTTLLNVVTGLVLADAGTVAFRGVDISGKPPHAIAARGIVRTFQIVRDLQGLSVLETLLLAPGSQIGETVLGALFRRKAAEVQERLHARKARDILERVGLWKLADASSGSLSGGQKKLLELARALMLDPQVVLLDEPGAGVAPPLLDRIVALILELRRDGMTFAIVEHDMHMIGRLCDHINVLAEGSLLSSGRFEDVTSDPRVVEAYLGLAA